MLLLERIRIANGKREIRVCVFLKKMSTLMRIVQNNSGFLILSQNFSIY